MTNPLPPALVSEATKALRLLLCEQCVDEHVQNTQSISCYCDCHSSSRDEANSSVNKTIVLAALFASRTPTTPTVEEQ